MHSLFRLICRTLLACFLIGWHLEAHAAATITFTQVGSDVQATISGSFDLTGLNSPFNATNPNARVRGGGAGANVVIGPTAGDTTKSYITITGPTYIGCATDTIGASSGTANPDGMFGINMAAPARLLVPSGYASGANVSASSTWNGATISSLGLIEGTYQYTWAGDSLTIIIPGPSGCLSVTNSPQSYTGSPIAATVTCSSGGSASNILYNGSSSVPSAAGTYAITANCTAGSNLLAVIGGSAGNLVISPATPTLSISNSPQTYTGSGLSATVSCLGGGTVSNVLYGGSATLPIAAGTYAVTANCAASSNYAAVTNASAGTFVISAASQSINLVATPNAITVSGTSALSITGANGTGAVTYSLVSGPCTLAQNPAVLTGTGAGSCVVTATIAADPNHGSASSNPVTVTVAGPPIVTNVTAIPGAGFIKVVFDVVNSAFSSSVVRVQTAVMYTATCTSTDGGVTVSATGPGSPLNLTGTTAGKSYTCSVTGTDGSGSSTSEPSNVVTPAPAPPPVNPIPTMSEWAQIGMMLMMIGAVAWQTRRVIGRR